MGTPNGSGGGRQIWVVEAARNSWTVSGSLLLLIFHFQVTVTEPHDDARTPIVCCKMRTAMLSFRCISVDCSVCQNPKQARRSLLWCMYAERTYSAHINLFMCMDWIAREFGSGVWGEIKGKHKLQRTAEAVRQRIICNIKMSWKTPVRCGCAASSFSSDFGLACARHGLCLFSPNFCMWQAVCHGESEILSYGRIRSHYINIVEWMRWWQWRRRLLSSFSVQWA